MKKLTLAHDIANDNLRGLLSQWVFKDGALYIDMLGTGMLIPVPGGGASGCFDLNLQERIVKLRSRIEGFPPPPR
jgi:hypothetical protein